MASSFIKATFAELPTDPTVPLGAEGYVGDHVYKWNTVNWVKISTGGAGHAFIKGSDIPVYGNILKFNVWGDELTKIAAPGAVVIVPDMRRFGAGVANFSLLPSGAVATHRVQIAWSQSGADADKSAYADLLAAGSGPGNLNAQIAIKDFYAHFLITQAAAVENIYAYISGRELA